MVPSVINMPPTKRKRGIPKKGASSRQREIHHGTKPATNPGAMTRKTTEPTIAKTFLVMSSCKQVIRPGAMEINVAGSYCSLPTMLLIRSDSRTLGLHTFTSPTRALSDHVASDRSPDAFLRAWRVRSCG